MDQNTAPVLAIGLAAGLAVVSGYFMPAAAPSRAADSPPPPLDLIELTRNAGPGLQLVNKVFGFVIQGGALICLGAGIAWCVAPDARRWLRGFLGRTAVRPLPALRLLDFVAAFAVYLSATQAAAIATLRLSILTPDNQSAASMIVNALGISCGVATGVFLARHRAGGKHGSSGIWPFWQLALQNPRRPIVWDIAAGVLAYPLLIWTVFLAKYANAQALQWLGAPPDSHRLIPEMLKPLSVEHIVIIIVLSTAGAAVFEEILFRGMLYNALRRYLGRASAAFVAAAIFSAMHHVQSDFLPLLVLALILTWLYDWTGRLVAGMTLHAVNNLVMMLMLLMLRDAAGTA